MEPESQALVLEVLGALHPSRSLVWTLGRRPALPGGVDAVAVRGYGLVIVVFVLGGESAGGVGVGGGVGAGHCRGDVASPAMPGSLCYDGDGDGVWLSLRDGFDAPGVRGLLSAH